MGYMILQFRMTLARQFRSSRGRIFLLLAAVLTAAALIPANPVPSPAPIPAKKQTRTVIILYFSVNYRRQA